MDEFEKESENILDDFEISYIDIIADLENKATKRHERHIDSLSKILNRIHALIFQYNPTAIITVEIPHEMQKLALYGYKIHFLITVLQADLIN